MGQVARDSDEVQKLADMIKDCRIAMLCTVDEDGSLRSRPMATIDPEDFDGTLWFFTSAGSHKVLEVKEHQAVNVAYAQPDDQHYVSVSGNASLVRDKARLKELWKEPMRTWFPKGLDDPDIALLRIEVTRAEYWDSPSSAMVYAYGYLKARLTGERANPGENKKIDFS